MRYYAQMDYYKGHQMWDNEYLMFESKVAKFLEDNDFAPYTIQRDGWMVNFTTEQDRNFFLLNFPEFNRI